MEKITPVPSGTFAPFRVAMAWIVAHKPAVGFALFVKRRTWSALLELLPFPPGRGRGRRISCACLEAHRDSDEREEKEDPAHEVLPFSFW